MFITASRRTDGMGAVLSGPSLQTDPVPRLVAGVVAEGVVARAAVGRALRPVVVFVTEHVVGVPELALVTEVHVLGPLLSNGESAAGRQAADQIVLVICRPNT